MQPIHNTLSEDIRAQSIELLNKLLPAVIDLHAQERAGGSAREAIDQATTFRDADTADLFTELSRGA
jgi:hypothetical protein